MNAPQTGNVASSNVRRLAHMELTGAGQVCVQGNYAYIGHLTNSAHLGTSIVDISDPRKPRVVSQIRLDDPNSHSHKARVVGDLMIVNSEMNASALGRKSEVMATARRALEEQLGRAPTPEELAEKLSVSVSDLAVLEASERNPYEQGGFKLYDVSDKATPKLISFVKTGGRGVHRYDMDANYAHISTEMPGYLGAILVIYDIRNPSKVQEVSRWWMPGQHIAGGETPTWLGRQHRLHHALRYGDEMWASCWHGGFHIVDISDLSKPKTKGGYNYHPLFPEPTHTAMPVPQLINGKRIALAIDEEDQAQSANEEQMRRGRAHACILTFDVTDPADIKPLAQFQVSEFDSPYARTPGARFGAHQFCERMSGT
ncbi:MAG: RNA polymerase subunit sigma-70, partial [Betaproteobacteria bacterium]